jgi:hypothetical protein
MKNRSKLRDRYDLKGEEIDDGLRDACFPCCGLMQEEKEVRRRLEARDFGDIEPMLRDQRLKGYSKNDGMAVPVAPQGREVTETA